MDVHVAQDGALHELKLAIQRHFSDGLVTIIGSGLSIAEGVPGMVGLSSYLDNEVPKLLQGEDLTAWEQISLDIKKLGLEAALTKNSISEAIAVSITRITSNLIMRSEKDVLSDVFISGRKLRLTDLLKFILPQGHEIHIITTNYDRLVEIAAEEAGLGVDTMFTHGMSGALNAQEVKFSFCRNVTSVRRKPQLVFAKRVVVSKPHGSLDWYPRNGRPIRVHAEIPGSIPLIIPPGRNKFAAGYESPFDSHRERANRAINNASRFLIIGYGFNDSHLETHLRAKILGGTPALILTHSLTDNAQKIVEQSSMVTALVCLDTIKHIGTLVVTRERQDRFEGLRLWDIGHLVREVLSP